MAMPRLRPVVMLPPGNVMMLRTDVLRAANDSTRVGAKSRVPPRLLRKYTLSPVPFDMGFPQTP